MLRQSMGKSERRKEMGEKKKDVYYFSGTHWDREWYQTFQGFRFRLVKVLNGVVKTMEENPDFGVFHMDGQTIVLEDYAEINPEGAEKLKALIAKDRVKVGPWYVMPDEFILSGESLIRNLMQGHKLAKKWGAKEAWKFGYICDIFGHIAQMPQIFRGFDIPYSLFCRGAGKTEPYFIWQAPDGSECINFRMGDKDGYGEYCLHVLNKSRAMEMNSLDEIEKKNKEYMEFLFSLTDIPVYVIMDALDHMPMHADAPKYQAQIEKAFPDVTVHQTDLTEAGKQLEKYRDQMKVRKGEMNTSMKDTFGHLISNTLSSYYTLKKANDACQSRLEKVVEPMLALGAMTGYECPRSYVETAYRYLIQNHPHDSICGCSLTQVHKDMEYRFDQTKEICETLENDFMWENQRPYLMNYDEIDTDGVLTVYNTLPFARDGVVEADLLMKRNYPKTYAEPFGYETINSFRIYDSEGKEYPYQTVDIHRNYFNRVKDQYGQNTDKYRVAFWAKLPAGGKSEFKIVPSETPSRYLRQMVSGDDYMENEYLKVTVTSNGELSIFDKKTKKTYENQLRLMDDSEIGDGWFHANSKVDRTVSSAGISAVIEKTECGMVRCSFRITKDLVLPAEIFRNEAGVRRGDRTAICKAVFEVSLDENARAVDVKLHFDNQAKDHRLRLFMPTYVKSDTYFAGQAFYRCLRPAAINYDSETWAEPEVREKAMNGIVGMRNEDGTGLAFVAKGGLHECAALDDENGTIAVTLLRAFRTTVNGNGETRCQLNGMLDYSFSLVPLDREVAYSDLVKKQDLMAAELLTGYREVEKDAKLIAPSSLISVSGRDVCTSIIKQGEQDLSSVVVRIFNASDAETEAKIAFDRPVGKAGLVNLNEEPIEGEITVKNNEVSVKLSPWKIRTVSVSFA